MINKLKNDQKVLCWAVFGAMFVFLLMQFSKVMVYFDDYGYYSLSYGVTNPHMGHTYTFSQLFLFLKEHYFTANGRLPGYLLWLSLYKVGGLTLVQISGAVIVTLILFVLWNFVDAQNHSALSALLICAFYGLFSIRMQQQGTYWFAAFFQYVAPVAAIVTFVIYYFKHREAGFSWKSTIVLLLLALISSYSQEQLSVTVTFMMILLLVFEILQKRVSMENVLLVIVAAAGVAALMLSPSSQNRASGTGYTLIETVIYSTYKTIRTFFAADISVLVCLLYVAVFSFSFVMFKEDGRLLKWVDLCGILFAAGSLACYMVTPLRDMLGQITYNRYYLLIVVGVPSVALIAIQIMRYYWTHQQFSRLLVFMTAVGSVGCLCVVPEVPPRLFIPSWMMLFPLLCDGIFVSAKIVEQKWHGRSGMFLAVICAVVIVCSSSNAFRIYRGYAANAEAYRYNDVQFLEAAEREQTGENVEAVFLKKMPDVNCAAALIYHEEVTYMKHWIKLYYGITSDPKLYFNADGTKDDHLQFYTDQGNNVYMK